MVRASTSIVPRGVRRGAAAARHLRSSSSSWRWRRLVAVAGRPGLRTWQCWQALGAGEGRRCARRIGFVASCCVDSTASRSTRRAFGSCSLSRCSGCAERRVAGMGSATLARRGAWPAIVVAARGWSAAARSVASRLTCGSGVAVEAGVRGLNFTRRGNGRSC